MTYYITRKRIASTIQIRWMTVFLLIGLVLGSCGWPQSSDTNVSNVLLTIVSLHDNKVFKSDVVSGGASTDDIVTLTVKSERRSIGGPDFGDSYDIGGPSPFDTVILSTCHVAYIRSDGGLNPADFTIGINLTVPADSERDAEIVLVRAFDKNRSPLKELWNGGQILTTAVIALYGEDGYGNDIVVHGSLPVSFGNYPDN